jgi:D-amino-acid oxidase
MHDVLVVGAGIVGLTSAVRLQQAGAKVAVVTADEPAQTVSTIAAAVWYPTHTREDPRVLAWARRTFEELAAQATHGVPGVVMRPTRMLLRAPRSQPPWWAKALGDFRVVRPVDVSEPFAGEWQFTVPNVEMRPYLHWLIQRVTRGGGVLLRRRIARLADVAGLASVVVNATGLAAGGLARDPSVYPVRGHLVIVANPGLQTSVRDEDNPAGITYIHPRGHDVVLGGTFEPGEADCTPSASVGRAILERCAALIPELEGARVVDQLVGLRPARHGGVRLALDPVGLAGGVRLVHAYGHGGAGVTLAWGCADDIAKLAGWSSVASAPRPAGRSRPLS